MEKAKDILLTIGIPTYNRSTYLQKCLNAVCSQIKPGMPVELLVSDNHSSDGTEKLVKEFAARSPFLRYVRQEENIGASNNFRYLWRNARGRFVLLIGDDDYLAPGAVDFIIEGIEEDRDVAVVFMMSGNPQDKKIYVGGRGQAQFVQYVSYLSTWVSTIILRRDFIDIESAQEKMDSMGMGDTALFQNALTLNALKDERKFTLAESGWFLPGTGESVYITPEQYSKIGREKGLPDLGEIFIHEYIEIINAYLGQGHQALVSADKKRLLNEFIVKWTALSAQRKVRWGAGRVIEYYDRYYKDEPFYEEGRVQLKPYVDALDRDIKTNLSDKGEQFDVMKSRNGPMKVVLLAGGLGTRIAEESVIMPKPMVEIGGMPILWHIMKIYSHYGFNDFIICAGYKQHMIKEWFNNYFLYKSDVTFDFTEGKRVICHEQHSEPWRVTVVDTGAETMTGGRIKRIQPYIGDSPFLMTYGDGVCDVDINKLVAYHRAHGKLATLTAVQQEQSKGVLDIGGDNAVHSFREKSKEDSASINAGFMVLEPEVFDYLNGDDCIFEKDPLRRLAEEGELMSYQHRGFWQCMDTLREKIELEKLWKSGEAPWKVW